MTVDSLPNEIWLQIIKKLNLLDLGNLLLVNKNLHYLAVGVSKIITINHDLSLVNDFQILEQISHIKKVFMQCGTNECISSVAVVNKTQNSKYCPESNYPEYLHGGTGHNKLLVVNLLPQLKLTHFAHQDGYFMKILIETIFAFCFATERISFIDVSLQNDHMKYIPERIMRKIHGINLCGCDRITNDALNYIGMYSEKLKYINLTDCLNISDKGLLDIIKYCPAIEYLDLSSTLVTNIGICSTSHYCRGLLSLSISQCMKLTCEGFVDTTEGFKNLEKLNLSSNYERITDKGISILARKCTGLTCLDITYSFNITDISIFSIANRCEKLSVLIARKCPNITEEGIIYLVRKRPKLKVLDISEIEISNRLLFAIADNCSNMEHLNMKKSLPEDHYQEGYSYILENCALLKTFNNEI